MIESRLPLAVTRPLRRKRTSSRTPNRATCGRSKRRFPTTIHYRSLTQKSQAAQGARAFAQIGRKTAETVSIKESAAVSTFDQDKKKPSRPQTSASRLRDGGDAARRRGPFPFRPPNQDMVERGPSERKFANFLDGGQEKTEKGIAEPGRICYTSQVRLGYEPWAAACADSPRATTGAVLATSLTKRARTPVPLRAGSWATLRTSTRRMPTTRDPWPKRARFPTFNGGASDTWHVLRALTCPEKSVWKSG